MKKKSLAIIVIAIITIVVLSACGGGNSGGGSSSGSGSTETYDVGKFTVSVPSGWTVFPQSDIFGDQDDQGNYPVDPESIFLAKGASDEMDAYGKPSIYIYWFSPDTVVMDAMGLYDDVDIIDGVTINGKECSAYEGTSYGYRYQFIHYQADNAQYDFNILVSVDGKETGITWEDPDVKTILESVASK